MEREWEKGRCRGEKDEREIKLVGHQRSMNEDRSSRTEDEVRGSERVMRERWRGGEKDDGGGKAC